jgi:ketosteroid isomerase-like protein
MPAFLNRIRPLTAGTLLTVGACSTAPATLSDAERQTVVSEVRDVMNELLEAMNAHDPDRAVSFYSDAPEFVALTCTSYITGGTTFKALVSPTYGPRRGATFEHRVVRVQALSPTAAVVSLSGSSSEAPALFWTRVLVKEEGGWLITYEHQSWPGCSEPTAPHPFTTPGDSAGLLDEGGTGS